MQLQRNSLLAEKSLASSLRKQGPISPVGYYDAGWFNKAFGTIRNIDGTAYGSLRSQGGGSDGNERARRTGYAACAG
jgi:hypothetical protein